MLQITPTPSPQTPTISPATTGVPDGLTLVGILVIVCWIILQQLPSVLKSLTELFQTVVANRKQQNIVFQDLSDQMKRDREYWDKERERMQQEIDDLRKELNQFRELLEDKDQTILKLQEQIKQGRA